jgi:hypothetical protein
MLMTAAHGAAPDMAVTDRRLDVKIKARARRDSLFVRSRQGLQAFPAQRDCSVCPPLRHSLYPAAATVLR